MDLRFDLNSDDPVTAGIRASARQLLGVAAFSGVVNLLTLSGSLYMLQVYDRVIPSRSMATLADLSSSSCLRTCCRAILMHCVPHVGAYPALTTPDCKSPSTGRSIPAKGARPVLTQQPLRDLDQVRTFLFRHRSDGVSRHAVDTDLSRRPLFHPVIGTATLGAAGSLR
jgi:ABC-type protease/lipase transport system fused ATPase/permease subunit